MHGRGRAWRGDERCAGSSADYCFSMTPAREAVRRLVSEGALFLVGLGPRPRPRNCRTSRIEELAAIRALLEPELAARALPRAPSGADRADGGDQLPPSAQAVARRDAVAVHQAQPGVHRTLNLRAQAPAMLALGRNRCAATWPDDAGALWAVEPDRTAAASPPDRGRPQGRREPGLAYLAVRADVTHTGCGCWRRDRCGFGPGGQLPGPPGGFP